MFYYYHLTIVLLHNYLCFRILYRLNSIVSHKNCLGRTVFINMKYENYIGSK